MEKLPLETLVQAFVDLALEEQDAIFWARYKEYNRLYDIVVGVVKELSLRPGDGRTLLLPLLDHASVQVRMNAAFELWDIARDEARAALELIDKRNEMPQAADARGWLWRRQGH